LPGCGGPGTAGRARPGGTAIGTGINTAPGVRRAHDCGLAEETGLPLREAPTISRRNPPATPAWKPAALKTVAVSLIKIANDIRLLGSAHVRAR